MTKQPLKVPELPEGWFFEVSEDTLLTFYKVALYRPRKFLGISYNALVDRTFVYEGYEAEDVQEAMERLIDAVNARKDYRAATSRLVGKYPPKEL